MKTNLKQPFFQNIDSWPQEILFLERRQTLLKFVDLFEGLSALSAWCSTASHHLNMDLDQDRQTDVLSQIRQIDYLLSKARGQ